MERWKLFVKSLSTRGGAMLLLTVIVILFYPLLILDNAEEWKAVTFTLGAIIGIVNSGIRQKNEPPL